MEDKRMAAYTGGLFIVLRRANEELVLPEARRDSKNLANEHGRLHEAHLCGCEAVVCGVDRPNTLRREQYLAYRDANPNREDEEDRFGLKRGVRSARRLHGVGV